jgi:uncharacterized protein (DUF2147 family)
VNNLGRKRQVIGIGVLALASVLALANRTTAADDKSVYGYWKHIDEDSGKTQSIFKLWEYQGKLVGKIVKTYPIPGKKKQDVCSECSGSQKGKPVEGLLFFWNFVRDDENKAKWVDGKILNPEDGKVYNAEAELSADGQKLSVFGYIRLLVKVGGTSVWQRPTAEELKKL